MKKYITPEISNIKINVKDIIQVSTPEPPIQETVEALGRKGLNIGGIDASQVNLLN